MEEWISLVGNVGFPIVVAFYLLIRFERKIDNLTDAINKMADIMEHRDKRE
ncbi:YvrJ family protein [Ectobacillus funiculus]|uniref:YvrJ family protein n=1 Tax=Ectobacillus funiculus TaxID=137993 RepID=A0ABV5WE43_9BACI